MTNLSDIYLIIQNYDSIDSTKYLDIYFNIKLNFDKQIQLIRLTTNAKVFSLR